MVLSRSATDCLEAEAHALCEVMAGIHQRGWCEGTGGNFSVVLSRTPMQLLMAPSGVDKGSLAAADLIVVDGHGNVIQGKGKASAETLLHLTIIATTEAGAVLHTHSQAATLLSRLPQLRLQNPLEPAEGKLLGHLRMNGLEMLKGLEGIITHEHPIAIPILNNSQDMALLSQAAEPYLSEAPFGILISGHGLYAWGDSLYQAKRHLEIHEFLLEQHWRELMLKPLLSTSPAPQ